MTVIIPIFINNTFNSCSLDSFNAYSEKTLFSYPKTFTLISNLSPIVS